jgi:rhodanese-related sulfurtransferase
MRGKTVEQLVAEAQENVGQTQAQAVKSAIEKQEQVVILDIRDKEEYAKEHLPGAISLPRGRIEVDIDEVVPDQDTKIVTYCGGKTRGTLSANTLKIMGYENVTVLSGGFRGWKAAGLPTEGEDEDNG